MNVNLTRVDRRFKVDSHGVRAVLVEVMRNEAIGDKTCDIIFCRDSDITRLNRKFKGRAKPTDVLAFDLRNSANSRYLGEIYINLQMARRQSASYGVPYIEEIKRLTIHGLLHLLGYRDDTAANRKRMWARQEGYLGNGE